MNLGQRLSEHTFDRLVQEIYDAAIEPALWSRFLVTYSECLEGSSALLVVPGPTSAEDEGPGGTANAPGSAPGVGFLSHSHFEPGALREYGTYYHRVNPWIGLTARIPEGGAYATGRLISDRGLARSEYNDWLRRWDIQYCLGVRIMDSPNLRVSLVQGRARRRGDASDAECRFAEALAPHLKRACALNLKLLRSDRHEHGVLAALDTIEIGAIALDARGCLLEANTTAQAIVATQAEIFLDAMGLCRAREPATDQALTAEIQAATGLLAGRGSGKRVKPGTAAGSAPRRLAVPRPPPQSPLWITITALHPQGEGVLYSLLLGERPATLVLLVDPDRQRDMGLGLGQICQRFCLSPKEGATLRGLLGGRSPTEIAAASGRSINTVRSQLKAIYAKTRTHSQADLIRLLIPRSPGTFQAP